MKKLILPLLIIGLCFSCEDPDIIPTLKDNQAAVMEVVNEQNKKSDDVFMIVEEQPTYPGGNEAWFNHLQTNLNYPEQARKAGIEGAVFISFVVNKDGSLEDYQVIRGIGAGCDAEALRVLMESENWNPGKQRGEVVKTRMQIRIVFKLNGEPDSGPVNISTETPQIIEVPKNTTRGTIIENDPDVLSIVEERPTYPGGNAAWANHLKTNLQYPEKAKRQGVEGAVFLSFVVDKDGSIINPQVVRGIGEGCDEEALRVLKESDRWNPGKQGGEIVKARIQTRIVFKMAP